MRVLFQHLGVVVSAGILFACGKAKTSSPDCEWLTGAVFDSRSDADMFREEREKWNSRKGDFASLCVSEGWGSRWRGCLEASPEEPARCVPESEKLFDLMKTGRMSEADLLLTRLATALKAYWNAHKTFPVATAGPSPTGDHCRNESKTFAPTDFPVDKEPWAALAFAPDASFRFSYDYTSAGTTATIHAISDLDCDENGTTTVTLLMSVENGKPTGTFSKFGSD